MAALTPCLLTGHDWWGAYDYPQRLDDQFFGDLLLEKDLLPPTYYRGYMIRPRTKLSIAASGKSEVCNGENEFEVCLDMSQFKPEELEVKVVNNYVEVHAKHEEKSDEHGFISRKLSRRYMLPHVCKPEKVNSEYTLKGELIIRAPKEIPQEKAEERAIPVVVIGRYGAVEDK